jgi:hypothetical protein
MAREPVRLQQLRSVITQPSAGQEVTPGDLVVRGVAWSGAAPIDKVEVSVGGGPWQHARLIGQRHRHSWQWWELPVRIDDRGETTLRARTTDLAGPHAARAAALEPPRLRRQRRAERSPARPVTTVLRRSGGASHAQATSPAWRAALTTSFLLDASRAQPSECLRKALGRLRAGCRSCR